MSHHAKIAREDLARLHQLRPMIWLKDFLLDWGVIVLVFWAFASLGKPWYLIPVAALIIGARLHALAILAHDGTHRVAFRNRRLNEFLSEVGVGWTILVTVMHGYRPWHFDHHRELGTIEDPEISSYRSDKVYETPSDFRRICRLFVTDMLGFGVGDLLKFHIAVLPKNLSHMAGPVALWIGFLGVCLWTNSLWVFALWSWSIVSGFWAVFRIRTWSEHVGAEGHDHSKSHRFSAGPIARFFFFPHNTYCHFEHHIWSQVPYYNLPLARALYDEEPIIPVTQLFLNFHEKLDPLEHGTGTLPEPERIGHAA